MQAFYFMKTLHLQAVEGRVTTVYDEQRDLFERLTNSSDSRPLFVEIFRETVIPFFNKHDIDYTVYRDYNFPHVLNDVRRCVDEFENGNYATNFEFINALNKIINNKEI